jgi:alpha/beta superfamily hydrolase
MFTSIYKKEAIMQTAIEITHRDFVLRGTLHIPEHNSGSMPIVILYHGFGGNKTGPHFLFVRLSRILERQGIASVRFDFAGSGESDGEFSGMTLSGELEDAKAILDFVKKLEWVDSRRIFVTGFSMGGAVASMLAGIYANDIRGLCLWAPAGNMAEIALKDFKPSPFDNGRYEFDGQFVAKGFIENIKKLNIYKTASGYPGRVLLLHGNEDEIVSIDASEEYLKYYGAKAELKVISGADHMFSREQWKQAVITHTTMFILQLSADLIQMVRPGSPVIPASLEATR